MDTNDSLVSFSNLLHAYQEIHVNPERKPTFLEIAGKAQKEDVISNILAFFFDPKQPHKLGTLFYSTFLQCLGVVNTIEEEIISVSREVTTAQGKRIDLLIETKQSLLVIENKVYHHLNNDLEEYAAHAHRLNKKKKCHLGVLSLYGYELCKGGFTNVTYDKFIAALEANINILGLTIEQIYAPFLNDLFTTIRGLKTQSMLDEKLRQFFISNQDVLDSLLKEKGRFDEEVNNKAHTLMNLFENRPGVIKSIWEKFVVVNHKNFPNKLCLKVDCVIGYEGYWIHVFIQRHGNDRSTEKMLEAIPYFKDCADWNTYVGETIPYDTPLKEVAEKFNEILRVVFP